MKSQKENSMGTIQWEKKNLFKSGTGTTSNARAKE